MDGMNFEPTPRRGFLGRLAAGAVAIAAGGLATKGGAQPAPAANSPWDDSWMTRIKGKHRQLFDAMEVHSGFPLAMAYVWMFTNKDAYNLKPSELSAVIVLRHAAVICAMNDAIWAKYKIGEVNSINDPLTGKPADRNVFATAKGFAIPPFPDASIEKLREAGAIFCACNVAMGVSSSTLGEKIGVSKDDAMKEWIAGLLPGVTRVPSGVLAVGRAQDHECRYCAT